jgi:hypothetical protein
MPRKERILMNCLNYLTGSDPSNPYSATSVEGVVLFLVTLSIPHVKYDWRDLEKPWAV